jgi:ketosteroid isomerase-like protein
MRPEDLERIRHLYDAMRRRDFERLREYAEANPGFDWQSAPDEPDWAPSRTTEEALKYARELWATFELLETEIQEVIDLGPDAAVFVVRHRVRGAASGVEAERSEAHLWTSRDGRLTSLREFATVEEAREAAGRPGR